MGQTCSAAEAFRQTAHRLVVGRLLKETNQALKLEIIINLLHSSVFGFNLVTGPNRCSPQHSDALGMQPAQLSSKWLARLQTICPTAPMMYIVVPPNQPVHGVGGSLQASALFNVETRYSDERGVGWQPGLQGAGGKQHRSIDCRACQGCH